ncbi:HdeD family acid-resistance protein [Cellulomonas sp. URHB0016]
MTSTMVIERRHTGWDVVFGLVLMVVGILLLGDVAFATKLSVWFIAWTTLIAGTLLLVGALLRIRSGGAIWAAVGGAILFVIGLFMLRNPTIGALTLTLLAGALFLTGGLVRLVMAFQADQHRVLLAIGGLISVGLGIWVLVDPQAATLSLLGILLGVQILLDGLMLATLGRLRIRTAATAKA